MRFLFAAVLAALVPVAAAATEDDTPTELTKLMTAYDAQGWEAVGRLNIGPGGMCTGALIAPNIVLTAAHCAYAKRTGRITDPRDVVFHAGYRNGRATASRQVSRILVHPKYVHTGTVASSNVAVDLALFELKSDIRLPNVAPFDTGARPRKGQQVGVVSYAHDRAENPSLQEVCHVLARQRGSLVLSCSVDFGSSGAPIFTYDEGQPRIVSVVSAKAEIRGRDVSLGTNLEKPLAELMLLLKAGGGQLASPEINIRRASQPRRVSSGNGAKFVRP